MSADNPVLIGRNRAPQRVHGLGQAVPTMGSGRRGSGVPAEKVKPKTADEVRAEEERRRDAQHVVTRCGLCTWVFDGTAGGGRVEARAHRAEAHPGIKQTKTRRDNLIGWKNNDPEQRAEAMKLVEQRRAFNARLEEAGANASSEGLVRPRTPGGQRGPASSSRRSSPAQQAIIDYLADGPRRLMEIAAHQGTKMATNGKTLHKLCERGLVVKRGHGLYALPDVAQERAA